MNIKIIKVVKHTPENRPLECKDFGRMKWPAGATDCLYIGPTAVPGATSSTAVLFGITFGGWNVAGGRTISGKPIKGWYMRLKHPYYRRIYVSCCAEDLHKTTYHPYGRSLTIPATESTITTDRLVKTIETMALLLKEKDDRIASLEAKLAALNSKHFSETVKRAVAVYGD